MGTLKSIQDLVERFKRNYDQYTSSRYKEAQLRKEFLDLFFSALGWDMANKSGICEQYKEVIHEDSIKVSGSSKAPDYCFRVGAERKFFVEAKKPSVNIKTGCHPAYQVRRYAWSANLPLSILTDFEELAIYDCRVKPNQKDKASTARIFYFNYKDYLEKWDKIASIFSRDSILQGSFDRYAINNKKPRGTAPVDDEFLKELEKWREIIAKNLVSNNKLTQRELNYSVQRTIDRILFLRISEDRGIEKNDQIQDLVSKKNIYKGLCKLFRDADEKYNSGLFHFTKEDNRPEPPDELSLNLKIDDEVLADIISNLYYPKSPYEFSVMPAEILGQVYEQFLGKTIKLVEKNRVKIEEKPIVKKAGGVYYTPAYIVDEIVKEVLGSLLKNKTPKEISKLKVLDPACGSGSFLIGAYEYLVEWYKNWYIKDSPKKHRDKLYQDRNGEWVLSTSIKKKILLDNIYGVDIDAQAVETTKLALLLKVLEGETEETISKQLSFFKERALPDLGFNIKCGNSLVDAKFYNFYQYNMFDDEDHFRINVFNWKEEFPKIFLGKKNGFDAVIGNPPYVRIQILQEIHPYQSEFFSKQYLSAQKGNYDLYVTFVEKGLEVLNANGRMGYILPHKFMNAKYGESLRKLLSDNKAVFKIVHFGDQQVFLQATTYTCLLYLSKKSAKKIKFEKVIDLNEWQVSRESRRGTLKANTLNERPWELVSEVERKLLDKLKNCKTTLETETNRIFQGFKTGSDKVFIVDAIKLGQQTTKIKCKEDGKEYSIESKILRPLIKGGDSRDFTLKDTSKLILFPYSTTKGITTLVSKNEMKKDYPRAWAYLTKHKSVLNQRENGRWKGTKWYMYSRNQALDVMGEKKIFTPDIAPHPCFSVDSTGKTCFTGGVAGGYGILLRDQSLTFYILGILNSTIVNWFIRNTSTQMRGGFYSFESKYIKNIPIPDNDANLKLKISKCAENIYKISERIDLSGITDTIFLKRRYQDQIKQLNSLVFKVFKLHDDEIRLITDELAEVAARTAI